MTETLDANGYVLQAGQRVTCKRSIPGLEDPKVTRGVVEKVTADVVTITQFLTFCTRSFRPAECAVQRGRFDSIESQHHEIIRKRCGTDPRCLPKPPRRGNL